MTTEKHIIIICCIILGFVSGFLLIGIGLSKIVLSIASKHEAQRELAPAIENYHHNLAAVLVTTNLVSVPCNCGYCRPSEGIRVPEHIGVVGYDLKVVVSTQYLPIVRHTPITN